MKAQSTIVAVILLLIITISLAGSAYVFMGGMLTQKISKSISVLDASCSNNNMTLVVSNDGTDDIVNTATEKDLKIIVDNNEQSDTFYNPPGDDVYTIGGHESKVLIDGITGYDSGKHTIIVTSPSNSIRLMIFC